VEPSQVVVQDDDRRVLRAERFLVDGERTFVEGLDLGVTVYRPWARYSPARLASKVLTHRVLSPGRLLVDFERAPVERLGICVALLQLVKPT
jgi:hypothetical protein